MALVKIDVSEEHIASIIRVTRIGTLAVTANFVPSAPVLVVLMVEVICPSEVSVLTRATWHTHLRR
jgi:hypothetical protein